MNENKKAKLGHHLEITEVHLNILKEQLFPNIKKHESFNLNQIVCRLLESKWTFSGMKA